MLGEPKDSLSPSPGYQAPDSRRLNLRRLLLRFARGRGERVGVRGNKGPLASGEAHIGCKGAGLDDDVVDRAAVAEHSVPLR